MADDTTYPARPVTPTPPAPATSTTYAPSPLPSVGVPAGTYAPSPLTGLGPLSQAIEHHESGGKNVTSPAGAQGPRQIMPATFKANALPGENINNPADNRAVGNRILARYLVQYNGDAARAAVAYFSGPGNVAPPGSPTPWIRNTGDGNNTVAQYVAATAGKMGGYSGAPTPSVSAAPATPTGVGAAIAALNAPTGQSGLKSTMDNLTSTIQDQTSQQQAPPMDLQGQQAAGINPHNQQVAAMAPQLMALTRAQGGLHGPQIAPSSMSFMGGQMIPMPGATPTPGSTPPGTTLNSTGGLYG